MQLDVVVKHMRERHLRRPDVFLSFENKLRIIFDIVLWKGSIYSLLETERQRGSHIKVFGLIEIGSQRRNYVT